MRRAFGRGDYCTVLQKGAEAAGAIFILHRNPSKAFLSLYGPAPQSLIEDEDRYSRSFEQVLDQVSPENIDTYLEKQKRFDPDIWVVELETTDDRPAFGE